MGVLRGCAKGSDKPAPDHKTNTSQCGLVSYISRYISLVEAQNVKVLYTLEQQGTMKKTGRL